MCEGMAACSVVNEKSFIMRDVIKEISFVFIMVSVIAGCVITFR